MAPDAHRMRRRKTPGGFSLVELVLVLTIVVVVAAIAIPRYSNWQFRYRADAAAKRIEADLNLARKRAQASSSSQFIVFDTDAETYNMPGSPDIDGRGPDYEVDLSRSPYNAALVEVDFGGSANLMFDGYGSPSSAGTIVVRSGDITKTITLYAGTAEIVIE